MASSTKLEELRPRVRVAVVGDLAGVVRVHHAAFHGFFLDRMGSRFLAAYYTAILDYPASIFLVHNDARGDIDGFAVGFRDPGSFYEFFRSRRYRMAPIIALSLLRRPSLLVEIARNTRRVAGQEDNVKALVELSSIATTRIGTGIGSILLRAFCIESRQTGATEITLTTDRDGNDPVLKFYEAHGFARAGIEYRGARALQVMTRDISDID